MEEKAKGGTERARIESIRGFLVYLAWKNRDMNTELKGLIMTLESWRHLRDKEGWMMRGKNFKISKLDGKWEHLE